MKKALFVLVFILFSIGPLFAQSVIIGSEKKIRSNILKEDRTYFVYAPEEYESRGKAAYPVFYVLDGNSTSG